MSTHTGWGHGRHTDCSLVMHTLDSSWLVRYEWGHARRIYLELSRHNVGSFCNHVTDDRPARIERHI